MKIRNRFFTVRLKIILPLLMVTLALGYIMALIYNLHSLTLSAQDIKVIYIYISLSIIFSLVVGTLLARAISSPLKIIKDMAKDTAVHSHKSIGITSEKEIEDTLKDLTRLKASWEEEKRKEILERLSNVSMLASKLSEEINAPLSHLKEIIRSLESESLDNPQKLKEYAGRIADEINRLQSSVDKVLNLPSSQSGDLRYEEMGLDSLLEFGVQNVNFSQPVELSKIISDLTEHIEARIIRKFLAKNKMSRDKTAQDLKISRKSLYNKMKCYGIEG